MNKQLKSRLFAIALGIAAPLTVAVAKPIAVEADVTVLTATVEAIDYKKHTVTLKGPEGNLVTYKVGKHARNFKQVKKGDQVKPEYAEAIAVSLQKPVPGAKPVAMGAEKVQVAGKGSKPFAEVTDAVFVIGKIESVDAANRVVTVAFPERTVKFKVAKGVIGLEGIKPGDEVNVEYTDALIFAVSKP